MIGNRIASETSRDLLRLVLRRNLLPPSQVAILNSDSRLFYRLGPHCILFGSVLYFV